MQRVDTEQSEEVRENENSVDDRLMSYDEGMRES
jgi:hypothetical protein